MDILDSGFPESHCILYSGLVFPLYLLSGQDVLPGEVLLVEKASISYPTDPPDTNYLADMRLMCLDMTIDLFYCIAL